MNKIIIGTIGKAGSGKDTTGDYICRKYDFLKMALADPIKSSIKEMFLLDDFTVYDRKEREKPLLDFPEWSCRKLFQFIGTELMRKQFDNDIWIKLLNKRIKSCQHSRIVISDIRFPNEVDLLKSFSKKNKYSVFFIKVNRNGYIGKNVGIKNHESESYDLDGDYIIDNNSNIDDLYKKIDCIMSKILEKN